MGRCHGDPGRYRSGRAWARWPGTRSRPCPVTVWVPRLLLKSVPVKPGSAAFTRMPSSALAYCTISIVSAVSPADPGPCPRQANEIAGRLGHRRRCTHPSLRARHREEPPPLIPPCVDGHRVARLVIREQIPAVTAPAVEGNDRSMRKPDGRSMRRLASSQVSAVLGDD